MTLQEFIYKAHKLKEDELVETFAEICDELKLHFSNNPEQLLDFIQEIGALDIMAEYEAEDGFGTEGFKKGEL
jgi:hypothetical protein